MPAKSEVVIASSSFWTQAQKAMLNVRQYGHLGRIPPDQVGDFWDEEFASAYERLRPFLGRRRSIRPFAVQAGLAYRSGPILAETACEALLLYINAPAELHGESRPLDAWEFVAIKAEAQDETMDAHKALSQRSRNGRRARQVSGDNGSGFSARAEILLGFLRAFHRFDTDEPRYTSAGTQEEIAKQLNTDKMSWDQGQVSKAIRELFADLTRIIREAVGRM